MLGLICYTHVGAHRTFTFCPHPEPLPLRRGHLPLCSYLVLDSCSYLFILTICPYALPRCLLLTPFLLCPQAMEAMDASIVALFDPHGYLQRNLSMLQSSPNAVDILVKHPTKVGVMGWR